ncbi:chromatin associated protein [Trichophaea hybrida]|nr:chromatin associated protein [Trichophaea hybrida]
MRDGYPTQPPQPTVSPGAQNQPQSPDQDQHVSPQTALPNASLSPALPAVVNNYLADLDPESVSQEFLKEGSDWFAVSNPGLAQQLEVDLVHTLDHNSVVCSVTFSHDGKYIATGCNNSTQIFDVLTGDKVATFLYDSVDGSGDCYIRGVCFSPDGTYLATGGEDWQIKVWNIASRSIRHTLNGHESDIYSLDFSRNSRHIVSGSRDRTVRVWDIISGENLLTLAIEGDANSVAISPDGRMFAAGSLDRTVRVWDTQTGYLLSRLEGHLDSIYSVAFVLRDGHDQLLLTGSLDKTIKMWEMIKSPTNYGTFDGKCIRTFEGHKDFVLSVATTPDQKWILSGSKDGGVQFWDPLTGTAHLLLQGHKNSVISVKTSPTGRYFATASGDMRARIWRLVPPAFEHLKRPILGIRFLLFALSQLRVPPRKCKW